MLDELFSFLKENDNQKKKYIDTLTREVEQKEENINLKKKIYVIYLDGNVDITTKGFVFAHNPVINFFDVLFNKVINYLKEGYFYYNKLKAYQTINDECRTKLLIHFSVMNDLLEDEDFNKTYPIAKRKIDIEINLLLLKIIMSLIIDEYIKLKLKEENNYNTNQYDEIEKYKMIMKDLQVSGLLDELRIDNDAEINVALEKIDIRLTQYFSDIENRENYILDLDNQLDITRKKDYKLEGNIDFLLKLTNICISKYRLAQKYIECYENRNYEIVLGNKFKLLIEYPEKINNYPLQDDYLGEDIYLNKISSILSRLNKHYENNPNQKNKYSYTLLNYYLNNNESNILESTFLLSLLSALEKGDYAIYQFYNTAFSEKEMLEAETGIKNRRIKKEESNLMPYITFIQLLSQNPFYTKVESISYYNSLELIYGDRRENDYYKKENSKK